MCYVDCYCITILNQLYSTILLLVHCSYAVLMGRYPWTVSIGVLLVIGAMVGLCLKFYPPTDINFNEPAKVSINTT